MKNPEMQVPKVRFRHCMVLFVFCTISVIVFVLIGSGVLMSAIPLTNSVRPVLIGSKTDRLLEAPEKQNSADEQSIHQVIVAASKTNSHLNSSYKTTSSQKDAKSPPSSSSSSSSSSSLSSSSKKDNVIKQPDRDQSMGPLDDPKYITPASEFKKRLDRVHQVCSREGGVPGRVNGVFPFQTKDVLYCMVPKAGCTFWKRVYLMMQRQPKNVTLEGLLNLPRLQVHGVARGKSLAAIPRNQYPVRLIATRDPFSRLVSSFLDKVYLPDFWPTEIQHLLRVYNLRGRSRQVPDTKTDFLRTHYENMLRTFGMGKTSPVSLSNTLEDTNCGKYATFAEFVKIGFSRAEPHWMPIHEICNPCQFSVTHVSRMDTFTQDARAMFKHMGMDHVLDHLDPDSQVDEELKMISKYNFNRVFNHSATRFYEGCTSAKEIAFRLWNNFRWRGYIHPDVDYVEPTSNDRAVVEKDLLQQVWLAREKGLKDPAAMKKAKSEFKANLFKTVPRDMFERLVQKYKTDFELFGYEESIDKIRALYT